jgi:hypothetical protein
LTSFENGSRIRMGFKEDKKSEEKLATDLQGQTEEKDGSS